MGTIGIYVTRKCNLKCQYCFAEKECDDINAVTVGGFIDEYCKNNKVDRVLITGGEPLLYKDLKQLINHVKKHTKDIFVLTNGILLNEEWLSYFESNNISLHISLDSFSNNYHEKLRGHFQETIKGLENVSRYEIKTTICMTVSHENIEEINKIKEYAEEKGFLFDVNLLYLNKTEKLSWQNAQLEQKKQVCLYIDEWSENNNRKIKGMLMKKLIYRDDIKMQSCYFGTNSMIIFPNGDVFPCFLNKGRYYGNIYDDGFNKVIDNYTEAKRCKQYDDCFSLKCLGVYY